MKATSSATQAIRKFFADNKIATLDSLKNAAGMNGTMTIFRALRRLGYLSSYSHRGQFYTLNDIPEFDEWGLWSCRSVYFSRFGTLLATAKAFVDNSEFGYTASELENALGVETKHALLKLLRRNEIQRKKIGGAYVYLSCDAGMRRRQLLMREQRQLCMELGMGLDSNLGPEELKAAIILFFSLLDEKQRRLYAGLEAAKAGHGGDRCIADLLGLDVHTVAKGRRELLDRSVERGRTRRKGGGRSPVEKKSPKY